MRWWGCPLRMAQSWPWNRQTVVTKKELKYIGKILPVPISHYLHWKIEVEFIQCIKYTKIKYIFWTIWPTSLQFLEMKPNRVSDFIVIEIVPSTDKKIVKTDTYSRRSQTSTMELFRKSSLLDIWLGSECASKLAPSIPLIWNIANRTQVKVNLGKPRPLA